MSTTVGAIGESSLHRGRLSDQLYEVLKADIVRGELPPGMRLVESEIGRRYELSLAPVREALKLLAHEGLVLQLPRRGSFVATISEDDARRSYAVRAVLEEVAAREFCGYGDDAAIEELADLLDRMDDAAGRDDLQALVELDIAFHRKVWEGSAHPVLPKVWPLMETSLRAFTTISNREYFESLHEIAAAHRPLLEALRRRDEDGAARVFGGHVQDVWDRANNPPARPEPEVVEPAEHA